MTEYQMNLAVLQAAVNSASQEAINLCADRIDQAAASGDRPLIDKIKSALPALGALGAAYEAAPAEVRKAFDERIDEARMNLDAGAIADLAAEIILQTPAPPAP